MIKLSSRKGSSVFAKCISGHRELYLWSFSQHWIGGRGVTGGVRDLLDTCLARSAEEDFHAPEQYSTVTQQITITVLHQKNH